MTAGATPACATIYALKALTVMQLPCKQQNGEHYLGGAPRRSESFKSNKGRAGSIPDSGVMAAHPYFEERSIKDYRQQVTRGVRARLLAKDNVAEPARWAVG